MAPTIPIVHVSELEQKVNQLPHGKTHMPPIELAQCERKEMVQYKCNVQRPKEKGQQPTIICEPVVRFYRQCRDGRLVETTRWEEWNEERRKLDGL